MASKPEYVFTRDFLDNCRIAKSAKLDGLDISLQAAPPLTLLPSNVTLREWDVRDDIPEDLIGVYDVIHVRFLSFVLLNDEIPGLVEKLFKLLKPGGYVQWGEPDIETVSVKKADPNATTEGLNSLFKLMSVQDPRFKPTWLRKLPQLLTESGFTDVETDTRDDSPHFEFMFHECGLLIYELIARKTKNEEMAKKVEELLPRAAEETRNGCYLTSVRWIVIGRKP
ncbi:hypothetical protein SLS62_011070 [Diatrype stigma]|uniref:Methyltransferase domain-containing protein n=1 Tax=Diatrype stigma TaxID=117547 RepID=A0AAN9UD30_9PEZI